MFQDRSVSNKRQTYRIKDQQVRQLIQKDAFRDSLLNAVHASIREKALHVVQFIDSVPVEYSAINYCKLYLYLLNRQLNLNIANLIKLSGLEAVMQPRKGWVSAGNVLFTELQYQYPDMRFEQKCENFEVYNDPLFIAIQQTTTRLFGVT